MPPRADQYDSMGGLLPIFEMNLPEGGLRERLRLQFAKAIPQFDDLDLLAIVGTSQVGRIRYSHHEEFAEEVPGQDIQKLLTHRGSEALFTDLLDRFAQYSGISGMQPKVLVREIGEPNKFVHLGSTHIVKSFNPAEYPELAANEMICTAGAARAGLAPARIQLSDDRKLLVVERFDRTNEGTYLGIEDFCVLTGRRAHGRYEGGYEDIGKRITDFVTHTNLAKAREKFALMVAYACAIENGDAHLKNFSVIYQDADSSIDLAPAYDIVSTSPYAPRDTLALTLGGSKQFPNRTKLVTFIRGITGKNERAAQSLVDQAIDGAEHALEVTGQYVSHHADATRFGEVLTTCIRRGISRLRTH
jgi:serine/threonine-protein kinase HipA